MVNIDTVYQKVLAFANKEQRGYITPQEFNLYANQAQQEIFEQYFYDIRQQGRIKSNEHSYPDMDDMLEEKLQILENTDDAATIAAYTPVLDGFQLPSYIYRVNNIRSLQLGELVDCEILNTKEFTECLHGGRLIRPSVERPIANIRNNVLRIYLYQNSLIIALAEQITYYKKPGGVNSAGTYPNVAWGYFVVGGKALYDTSVNKTFHFELHPSEENELVYKILKYAGVAMQRNDILSAGQGLEISQVQQEKQ